MSIARSGESVGNTSKIDPNDTINALYERMATTEAVVVDELMGIYFAELEDTVEQYNKEHNANLDTHWTTMAYLNRHKSSVPSALGVEFNRSVNQCRHLVAKMMLSKSDFSCFSDLP